jgi:hypothetical protein
MFPSGSVTYTDLSVPDAGSGFEPPAVKMSFWRHTDTAQDPLVEIGEPPPVLSDDAGMNESC